MSNEERNALEEGSFEVDELDNSMLEDVSGGFATANDSACNESGCNSSQCACPPKT